MNSRLLSDLHSTVTISSDDDPRPIGMPQICFRTAPVTQSQTPIRLAMHIHMPRAMPLCMKTIGRQPPQRWVWEKSCWKCP